MNDKNKLNWNLITGISLVIFNLYWTWDKLHLLYLYHYTGILFFIMFPDWVLITNTIIGLIGTAIGIMLLKRKMTIKKALIMNFCILGIGFLLFVVSR
mgnify:CR=1 FL=1